MKKTTGENWISCARSVAPAISMQTVARSATLAPRPRFDASPRTSQVYASAN